MKTLKEKIKELKSEFERWKKLLERMVDETTDLAKNTNKAVAEIREIVETTNKTIHEIDGFVTKLSSDYDKMRKELDAMKKNYWLKLFGVFKSKK